MIWALRGVALGAVIGLATLLLWPGDRPPTPATLPPTSAASSPLMPTLSQVQTPTPQTEIVVSRVTRETPTPRVAAGGSQAPEVSAVEFSYLPTRLSVGAGATVTWRNRGSESHDVLGTGPDGSWWSGPLAPTASFQRQFGPAGSYDYQCSFHAEMRGTIIVEP